MDRGIGGCTAELGQLRKGVMWDCERLTSAERLRQINNIWNVGMISVYSILAGKFTQSSLSFWYNLVAKAEIGYSRWTAAKRY